jgi:putative spermidine/putrescine transport system ATP-binding protein
MSARSGGRSDGVLDAHRPHVATRGNQDEGRFPALELRGVAKTFGAVRAVDAASFSVRNGEFLTLLGPSGSGKTTILRMVAGFERPTSGAILIAGRDVSALPPNRRGVGLVFQNYALFPHMTVEENVRYPLRMHRWAREDAARRVDEVLRLIRLSGMESRRPNQLSGGQQQRVALGRALAAEPSLLLMDEPLGALDRALRTEMQEELRRIHQEANATVLFVTHDREEALAMSTRIGIMRDGRLIQIGTPAEVYESPADRFVGSFLGECNVWPATDIVATDSRQARVRLGDQTVRVEAAPRAEDESAVLLIRPSRIRLTPCPGDMTLRGRVTDVRYFGEITRLTVDIPDLGSATVTPGTPEAKHISLGQPIELAFSPVDVVCVPDR